MLHPRPSPGILLGEWEPTDSLNVGDEIELLATQTYIGLGFASVVTGLLTPKECYALIQQFEAVDKIPVGIDGYSNEDPTKVGSVRATAWAPELAKSLFERLNRFLPLHRHMTRLTPTDWYGTSDRDEYVDWTLEDLSPVLRFMKYIRGGKHNTHYDCGYNYGDGRRTLMSFVVYLNSASIADGGCTRFINDNQNDEPVHTRDYSDWTEEATEAQVLAKIRPRAGSILFFDHKMAHDIEEFRGGQSRYIIRGDVVYKGFNA